MIKEVLNAYHNVQFYYSKLIVNYANGNIEYYQVKGATLTDVQKHDNRAEKGTPMYPIL